MTVSPTTEQALRAALERLTSGAAKHCDGEITVSNLAREAGVSRATANRATEIIADLHRRNDAPTDDDAQGSQRVETLRQQIRHLQSELAVAKRAVRADDDELRHRTALLAQQVQALALDNHRLREQLAHRAKVRNLHQTDRHNPE